jgi:predicted nuclease of predicted toxin-antitoxin system
MRRLLIDECVNPRMAVRLREVLPKYFVETVRDLGWAGKEDHLLIKLMADRFDVLLTIDKGIEFEHDLRKLPFGIIGVQTANKMPSYERVFEELVRQIQNVLAGQVIHVGDPDC